MADNYPSNKSKQQEIKSFLAQVAKAPLVTKGKSNGRLLFAMDATASREAMWDIASQNNLQTQFRLNFLYMFLLHTS